MPEEKGFSVNNFDHLEAAKEPGLEHRREASGWGIVREDLIKHHVHLLTDVRFIFPDDTPDDMKRRFFEASHVIHHIAEQAVMNQLKWDGLAPVETRDLLYGVDKTTGEQVTIRDSGWRPVDE